MMPKSGSTDSRNYPEHYTYKSMFNRKIKLTSHTTWPSGRLLSLDIFRGITIAAMVIVNSPGNKTSYQLLKHSVWNGCTLADLVFPFFIFMVGVSVVFSLSKCIERDVSSQELFIKIFKRTILIFALGLILNGFPHYDLSTLRIFGVLQRIALCYFFASILYLKTSVRTQIFIMAGLLIGYWFMMTFIPVLINDAGNLTKEGNLASYIDRLLFVRHLYQPSYDPEGLLSTVPAIATTILGNLTGIWLLSERSTLQKLQGMVAAAVFALITGWIWGLWFPINKSLWTSSFVLWSGGLALFLVALCYWLIEMQQRQSWSKPFEIFGKNALAIYFLHILFLKIQNLIHLPNTDISTSNLRLYITSHLFGWTSLQNASLFYALSYTLFWFVLAWILYRHRIFIKI